MPWTLGLFLGCEAFCPGQLPLPHHTLDVQDGTAGSTHTTKNPPKKQKNPTTHPINTNAVVREKTPPWSRNLSLFPPLPQLMSLQPITEEDMHWNQRV